MAVLFETWIEAELRQYREADQEIMKIRHIVQDNLKEYLALIAEEEELRQRRVALKER